MGFYTTRAVVRCNGGAGLQGSAVEEAQLLLDEHTVKTQAMKSSPFAAPIYEALVEWEKKLALIEGVLDEWLVCQMKWIYLEPVYGSEEILKQVCTKPPRSLPSERGFGLGLGLRLGLALTLTLTTFSRFEHELRTQ
jgi:hypothetical protein